MAESGFRSSLFAAVVVGVLGGFPAAATEVTFSASQAPGGFTEALNSALQEVNGLQGKAGEAAAAFERGETTDIAAVMLAKQQASVSFEATLQVRNKLLSAYKDIMSMPV